MTACSHNPPYPDARAAPTPAQASAACSVVASHPELLKQPRAVTVPDGNRTFIDEAFWRSLSPAQRTAVVAHERAHVAMGLDVDCESCADKVGGYLMRLWGYTPQAIGNAFGSLRVPRDAKSGAVQGAHAAHSALLRSGVPGAHSSPHPQGLLGGRAGRNEVREVLLQDAQRRMAHGLPAATREEQLIRDRIAEEARRARQNLPASTIPGDTPADSDQPATDQTVGGGAPGSGETVSTTDDPLLTTTDELHGDSSTSPAEGSDTSATTATSTTTPDGAQTIGGLPDINLSHGTSTSTATTGTIDAGGFTPTQEPEDREFFKQVKVQVVAGIIVAVILAVVLSK